MKVIKIGNLLLILVSLMLCFEYVYERKKEIVESNKISYSLAKETGYLEKKNVDTYDGVLSIPYIDLKKGIYKKDDDRNNIDENVTIHNKSNYPNEENSNLILMAHSGSGDNAYFNDLDNLNNDSLIEFYYNKVKYVYKIDNYYEIDKNGLASIKRNNTKKTITLITCSKKDKTKQLIYIGYLIDEIKL